MRSSSEGQYEEGIVLWKVLKNRRPNSGYLHQASSREYSGSIKVKMGSQKSNEEPDPPLVGYERRHQVKVAKVFSDQA